MDGRRFISHAVGSTNHPEANLAVESHWSCARWPTHLAIGACIVCRYLLRVYARVLLPLLHKNRLRPCLQPSRRRQFGIKPKAKSHRARHGYSTSLMPLPDSAAPPTRLWITTANTLAQARHVAGVLPSQETDTGPVHGRMTSHAGRDRVCVAKNQGRQGRQSKNTEVSMHRQSQVQKNIGQSSSGHHSSRTRLASFVPAHIMYWTAIYPAA